MATTAAGASKLRCSAREAETTTGARVWAKTKVLQQSDETAKAIVDLIKNRLFLREFTECIESPKWSFITQYLSMKTAFS
jgi:hypothetical protein